MTAADKSTLSAADPREVGTQLRPGLWHTINERYPGSMIRKDSFVPQARLAKPLGRIPVDACELLRRASEDRQTSGCLPSPRRFPFYARAFRGEAR